MTKVPSSAFKVPGLVTYYGAPTYAHHGPQAAVVHSPLTPADRDAVIKKLPHAVRNQLRLAKNWKVWAVYATDDWVTIHGRRHTPPPVSKTEQKAAKETKAEN